VCVCVGYFADVSESFTVFISKPKLAITHLLILENGDSKDLRNMGTTTKIYMMPSPTGRTHIARMRKT
jgi:hypothetical protein